MPADMCTKPYSGPIISWINKWMTGFRLYPTSDTEHYQLMKLHEFIVDLTNHIYLPKRTYYVIASKPELGLLV